MEGDVQPPEFIRGSLQMMLCELRSEGHGIKQESGITQDYAQRWLALSCGHGQVDLPEHQVTVTAGEGLAQAA